MRVVQGPVISVPTIALEGDANGDLSPGPQLLCQKFAGKYAHRTILGGVGRNFPQEAPRDFAQAVLALEG